MPGGIGPPSLLHTLVSSAISTPYPASAYHVRGGHKRLLWSVQWALGMLLYQLLSGTLPFWEEGESQSPFTVMTAILGGEVSFDGPAWQAISPHGA